MDVLGLGIQLCKRAKQLFFGLLDNYSGAAAAYSLRKLSRGYSGPIVRVRRDGDADGATNERDFNSTNQIADWVNGKLETTLPADVATASAAYSLRKVKAGYTGDAVRIRRASDDVEVNVAFDTNGAVSASSAITNVEDISLISESGFATDTGGFESSISGANFSSGNTLDGKSNVLFASFDGSGLLGLNFLTSDVAIGDVVTYSFDVYWESTNIGELPDLRIRSGNTTIGHVDVPMPSKDSWYTFSGQFTVTNNTPAALTLIAANSSGLTTGDIFAIANGSYSKKQDAGNTTATTLGGFLTEAVGMIQNAENNSLSGFSTSDFVSSSSISITSTNPISGTKSYLMSHTGTAGAVGYPRLDVPRSSGYVFELNTEYSIKFKAKLISGTASISGIRFGQSGSGASATPSTLALTLGEVAEYTGIIDATSIGGSSIFNLQFDGTDGDFEVLIDDIEISTVENDAHVQTWYDQSGNGNNATQDTAGNQPKIAEAGALLADGIDFDGVDDYLKTSTTLSFTQPVTDFSVSHTDITATSQGVWTLAVNDTTSGEIVSFFRNDDGFAINAGATLTTAGSLSYSAGVNYLKTGVYNTTSSAIFVNGTSHATGTVGTNNPSGFLYVGRMNVGASALYLNGAIKEIIVYDSDQSSNRFKIESNINNYYQLAGYKVQYEYDLTTGNGGFEVTSGCTITTNETVGGRDECLKATSTAGSGFNLIKDADYPSANGSYVIEGEVYLDPSNVSLKQLSFQLDSSSGRGWGRLTISDTGWSTFRFSFDTTSVADDFQMVGRDASGNVNFARTAGDFFAIRNVKAKYADNGFVETWYDQSGNGNHAEQTVNDDQPTIVNAGSLLADGIDFTGGATAHHFDTTHVIGATTTIFGVVTSDTISDFFLDMRDGASDGAFIFSDTGTVTNDTFRLQYNAVALTGSSGATGEKLGSFLIKDGSQKIRVNGTEVASGTTAGAISVTTTTKIGTRSFGAPTSNWTGHMKEIIIYNSDESANFSDIESNIADEYGITLP